MGIFSDLFKKKELRTKPTEQDILDGTYNPDMYREDSPTVRLCISRIAGTVATLPMIVQQYGIDVPRTNQLAYLLTMRPNDYQTITQFMNQVVTRLLGPGNVCIMVQKQGNKPVGLHVLDEVAVSVEGGQKIYRRRGKLIDEQIIHLHRGHLWDVPIAQKIPDLINLENSLLSFAGSYFENGLTPTTIITLPAGSNTDPDKYNAFKSRVSAEFAGAKKHGKPIFRQSKDIDVETKESQNARNAMLVESMEYVRSEIARHFHIPTAMIDSAKANNSIMESETIQYYRQAVLPIVEVIKQAFNSELLGTFYTGTEVFFDFDILLTPAPESQARINNIYRYAGVLTVNEIRKTIGYEAVEGGDVLAQPTNLGIPGATGEAYLTTTGKDKETTSNNANK